MKNKVGHASSTILNSCSFQRYRLRCATEGHHCFAPPLLCLVSTNILCLCSYEADPDNNCKSVYASEVTSEDLKENENMKFDSPDVRIFFKYLARLLESLGLV